MTGTNSSGVQPQRVVRLGALRHAMPAGVKRLLAARERALVMELEAPAHDNYDGDAPSQDQIVVLKNDLRTELTELRAFVKATV